MASNSNRNVLTIETKLKILNHIEKAESESFLAREHNVGNSTVSDNSPLRPYVAILAQCSTLGKQSKVATLTTITLACYFRYIAY